MSTLTYRVIYGDVDLMGFMYYANYLRLFEAGRNEYCRDHGITYKEIEAAGFFFPVVEAHAKYVRPARYDDLLTLKTWICRRTRVRLEFAFELLREGELLATGNTVHACINREGRPQRLPAGWEARFPVMESPLQTAAAGEST
ncbi:MAG: thioesterase family protein [Myxococcota bacterium]